MSNQGPILHADLDAFYASVEQRDDPALRGRPVIVGGGVVLACSYEAKARGVRSAMGGRQARRLCPDAIVVPPRMSAYSAASKAVFEVFADTTPLVEALSIDEAFLDVGGMARIAGSPVHIAERLRREVADRVGLPITVGVARTKFLAKVASAVAKPDGLLNVPHNGESAFLHPLPVERLWGVGKVTAEKLRARGLATVGQVAAYDEADLISLLGPATGRHLHALAHHRDRRRVVTGRRRRSIGAQHALGPRGRTPEELDILLAALVDRVTRRLRRAERSARTITLRTRAADYTRRTRSYTVLQPTTDTAEILSIARTLLAAALPTIHDEGITLIGVALSNLDPEGAVQLALPLEAPATGARHRPPATGLDTALDSVRTRFGSAAVTRAALLGRDVGPEVPLLPD
ncbi:DNA polymerase IV [Actinokineospora bangkokensis]|uniref:DNA polymerase IV n=1 Tax=Actinokineospora bangkokensis TaxID=1193682 RepID=UPI0018EA0476|nr:DNA polymerase IV [Actinokineospora bangkokensis]